MRPQIKTLFVIALALISWTVLYINLETAVKYFCYNIITLPTNSSLSSVIEFFIFEVPKVLLLLVIIVFFVGIIRTFFTPERTRKLLSGKGKIFGNILAALLGIVTPFCSCSAIPLFLGFIESGVPLGVTFSFLISAPMINEVAVVLLFGMFGIKIAAIYVAAGLVIAIMSGWAIGILKLEQHVEPWVYEIHGNQSNTEDASLCLSQCINAGVYAVKDIVGKVWPYVVLGIAVGAGIHGYVPTGTMAAIMGKDVWWSVPVAVAMGVPMYSNAAGIIPIMQALLEKGAALGTALAFMMAVIVLSLPEIIILRKVLKSKFIVIFIGIVASGITLVGYLFNWLI
ncbi:MAG: permease [Deltaproteobacteria bacterium]|nr:permease [Deltaproteobacteria bacterium]